MSPRILRSIVALSLVSLTLTSCRSSPPPADEMAREVVDAMDVPQTVKDCMHDVIDNFQLTEAERSLNAGKDLDEVSAKASEGNAEAQSIVDRFQAELTACNP